MSQQYTPVDWQDPTGSNPGTLINKARLDQMQSAHHYADGYEEVDTPPTASPGVSYHKVVYCTSDSAFYRWDGSAWAKDIDDVTKAELDAEVLRAKAAEEANALAIAQKYTKPAGGIPKTDLASDVQTSLGKADTAVQTIKTINSESLVGSGNIPVQTPLTAGTDYVVPVSGKGLSANDYTDADKSKLAGIEAGAQVNVIESVKVNGTALTPSSKTVDVAVPTKTSDLSNDSDYITATAVASTYATKAEITAVYKVKGSKATYSDLPSSGNVTGDVWNILDTGSNYVWDGSAWDKLSETVDLSGYVPKTTKVNGHALSSDITVTASDVGALPDTTLYAGASVAGGKATSAAVADAVPWAGITGNPLQATDITLTES